MPSNWAGIKDVEGLARAHDAIEVVADVAATLDDELVRSLRLRARGTELRVRAKELIEQARTGLLSSLPSAG